jgi:hypothetical protein
VKLHRVLPLLAVGLFACAGCSIFGTRYAIDSARTGEVTPGLFYLAIEQPAPGSEPEYAQALACVRTALAKNGFRETADPQAAPLHISFAYGSTFNRIEGFTWSERHYAISPRRDPTFNASTPRHSETTSVSRSRPLRHYNAWLVITAHVVDTDGVGDGWSVSALVDTISEGTMHVLPSLTAAASALLTPGAPAVAQVNLSPADSAVRAFSKTSP